MKCLTCFKSLLVLSGAGVLFAGYLSGVKFFSDTCAFGESCPFFLGYPACYFGFAMYVVMFVVIALALMHRLTESTAAKSVLSVSILGILFSGYYTTLELPKLFDEGIGAYMLGLPTCALGLIFYVAIFAIAVRVLCKLRDSTVAA